MQQSNRLAESTSAHNNTALHIYSYLGMLNTSHSVEKETESSSTEWNLVM